MPKITFIGAGSTIFAKNLLGDIFCYPELQNSEIMLYDIDPERLRTSEMVARRLADLTGSKPIIRCTLDLKIALIDSDYVLTMFQIGGYKPATVTDFEIPKKYGLRQTIGDTLGIGGIMRGLRTIPVIEQVVKEMESLCPNAILINYVNPMAINCWAANRISSIRTVGLCHSVQGTAAQLAEDIRVPIEEINYLSAGINHMAFYLKFEQKTANGVRDLYPLLRNVITENRIPDWNRVRYEFFNRFGYFVTESSEHFSEYTPYFIKSHRPDLLEKFNVPLDEYLHRSELNLKIWHFMQDKIENPGLDLQKELSMAIRDSKVNQAMEEYVLRSYSTLDEVTRSHEYGVQIIHAMETGQPTVVYGNVRNDGLIDNLPNGCTVEVPCLVDRDGVLPTHVGNLPVQLAAIIQTNVNVQALTVEAAITKKKEHIYHAAMLDPHTAAELAPDQICRMVDDLLDAHQQWLPEYH